MLLTAALIAGLVVVVVLTFQRWVDRNELVKTTDTLIDLLDYARSVAMTSQMMTEVCPRETDQKCGADWDQGLLLVKKDNQSILRVERDVPPEGYFVLWRPALQELPFVRFRSDGFVYSGVGGSFYICAKKRPGTSSRVILLNTGRTRAVTGDFAACHE